MKDLKINLAKPILAILEGFSSLPVVLLLGGIIITFALGASLLIYLLNNANLGERWSAEALAAANSGINDGILRMIWNKNCPQTPICPPSYNFEVFNNRTAEVAISKGLEKYTITAIGTAVVNQRKLEAVLEINNTTGQVIIESRKEVTL